MVMKVSIVGSGFLGTQIGALCSKCGYKVSMYDINPKAFKSSKKSLEEYINEWQSKDALDEVDAEKIRKNISFTLNLEEAVKNSDIVIEAVVENLDVKREVFKQIDELCTPDTLIATNSSSIKVSKIESATTHPERVLNIHFYSYPWRRTVLEIMKGTQTTEEVVKRAEEFSQSIGVYPLMVLKESTGFIYNRVWRAIKKECLTVVDTGVASFEDIDRAWMSLYKTGIGPFGMMDRVGLDVVRDIELVYYHESGDIKDKPPKILLDKLDRGELGVKTGQGFYSYPDPEYEKPEFLN